MFPSISLRFCNPRSLTLPWQVALPYLLGGYGKYQQAITQQKTFAILKTIIPHKKVNEYTNEKNKNMSLRLKATSQFHIVTIAIQTICHGTFSSHKT
jgi:hypothetical protein